MNDAMPLVTPLPRPGPAETLSGVVRSAVRVLVERFWIFAGTAVVLFVAAAIVIMMMTPKFDATATLKIDPTASPIAGVSTEARFGQPDRASIQSEVDALRSRDLAVQVATRLSLINDPEFDYSAGMPVPAGNTPEYQRRLGDIGQALLDSLWVKLNEDSYIVTINMTSLDPEKAARIANAFAEVYISSNVGARTGTAAQQSEWLENRRRALEQEVRAADAAVAQYRASAGIVEGGANGTITDQQIGPLAAQLAQAQSEAAEARAKVSAAREQIRAGNMDAVANVLNSQVVTALRTQRGTLVQNRDEIVARYGPRHPETIRVEQQLKSLDDQIGEEARRITVSLENEARASEARAASLSASLSQLRADQARNTRASVTADTLERTAEAKREAFAQLAKAAEQTEQAARNSLANVRIIESARAPDEPTSPNRPLLLAVAFLASLFAGVAVVTAQELLARGVRTAKDVEVRLGVPLVGTIPELGKAVTKKTLPADYLVAKPMTFFAEAFRSLRSSLITAGGERLPKVLAIVSALPAEGKSSTALCLARAMALAGDRVVLVDCDFRRVGIHAQTGISASVSLFDVLSNGADWQQAVVADRVAGLDLIGNDAPVFTPVDLVNGDPMRRLIASLGDRYDIVIIDTPPLIGLADARNLAAQADAVVMVAAWDATPLDAIDKALSQLQQAHAPVVGIALNRVAPDSELMGSNYYSRKYAAYYQS